MQMLGCIHRHSSLATHSRALPSPAGPLAHGPHAPAPRHRVRMWPLQGEGADASMSVFELNPNTQKLLPRSTLAENMLSKDFSRLKEAGF